MSSRLKKLFISAFFLLIMFTQNVNFKNIFPKPTSLTEKSIVQGVGTDISSSEDEPITITVASKSVSPSGGEQNGGGESKEQKSIIHSDSGKTFFNTINKMQSFSDKTLLLNYLDIVIVGEEAAKNDLLSHIEYLYTSPKLRMDLLIFVAKDCTAEEVLNINSIGEETVSEKLVSLINNVEKNSFVNPVTFYDIIAKMEDKYQYSRIPAIEIIKNENDENKPDIKLVGYALFKEKQLLCYLNEEQSRALNILSGEFKESPFVIENDEFGLVTLETINAKADIKYIPDDKYGKFEIAVNVNANFTEQYKQQEKAASPYSSEGVVDLQQSFNKEIEHQLNDLIEFSREINTDIAELSSVLKHKHPKEWKKLEKDWDNIYREIPVNFNINSHVVNFFTLHEQIGVNS